MSRVLFSDAYVTLTIDDALGLVRYIRSGERFPSVEIVRAVHEKLGGTLPPGAHRGLKLLVDAREAPPRNDDEFEAEITRTIGALIPRFGAHAMLMKSAVGRLQARRLAGAQGAAPLSVFGSEAEALEYLGITG